MTKVKLFKGNSLGEVEKDINVFLEGLGDTKVSVQYSPTIQYYEACVVYEVL